MDKETLALALAIAKKGGGGGGGGGAEIDDSTISTSKTWSSNKINTELQKKADSPTVLTSTLTAGSTSIQFTDSSIDSTKTIEVFTDPEIFHNSKNVVNNTLTITFDSQTNDVSVKVRIS